MKQMFQSLLAFARNAALASLLAAAATTHTFAAGAWDTVPLGGGGFVTGLVSNVTGSAIYCRTDVGGAFRWVPDVDGVNGTWISLTDDMVAYGTSGASSLMNVESIGTDPSNVNRVYVGAGNGIWGSDDEGVTWYQIRSSLTENGNGSYRSNGERLAVDPNDPNTVWYGSSTTGLQKGVKSGTTWTWVQIASTSVPFGLSGAGVTFVICDKNNGGPTIVYAGVHDATAGGIYRSMDAGATWSLVTGASLPSPRRAQLAKNGTLYVTGGTDGCAKLPRGGTLTLLSSLPTGVSYNGVATDPNDVTDSKVIVAEGNSGSQFNRIWRSADGGATWAMQQYTFNGMTSGSTGIPRTEPDGAPCLVGYWFGNISGLLINPANSNELWAADFFGAYRTRDAQDLGTTPSGCQWYTLQKGQEETVVAAVKNAPTGAQLLTGVGDVGGFCYQNVFERPTGTEGNSLKNPSGGNNTSLDFCESVPLTWARAWVQNAATYQPGSGAFSRDGGATWSAFGAAQQIVVPGNSTNTWVTWDLTLYLQQHLGGPVTLILRSATTGQGPLNFASRETANPPQLVLNGTTTVPVSEDTYVQDGSAAGSNFGTATSLLVKTDAAGYNRWTYLKFDLTGVSSITSATLRLYLQSTGTANITAGVYAEDVTSWTEAALNWNTRPVYQGTSGVYASTPPAAIISGSNGGGGGRIAVSSTAPGNFVWLPINYSQATIPAYYSKDGGVTWAASTGAPNSPIVGVYTNGNSLGMSGQCLAADRGNGYFYMGKFGGSAHLIYRSTNGGQTWTQVGSVSNGNSYNMRTPQLVAAPVSPTYPSGGDVWLCDDGTYNGNGGGLWRSTDSGVTWTKNTAVGKTSNVGFGKSSSGSGYSVYIAGVVGGVQGVYRSDDYGATWTVLPTPTIEPIYALTGDRQKYNSAFIGTAGRGTFHYYASDTQEAEDLWIQSSTPGDTVSLINDPNFSTGAAVELVSVAVGDQITFVVPNVTARSYDVTIGIKKYSNRGIWQLAVAPANGTFTNLGAAQDNYASGTVYTSIDLGTWTPTTNGDQWFRFTITGKNASSSGYTGIIDYIKLMPQ
ncbi:glycosyl hydrolase BNR repeat-containing protein [Chthoniobacter flavus Ellin428]|uniref:Glycosyl hydrolase BNR repeat-containing protein n=1 Tax=Chthoniobacter flavus Ellin428 TaxID=497964 RepID=B4CV48_9BACT|nr:DNRLRE domain-containing protein [Chthoniobacter flavus]EDY22436.1 glycosyl hydrolase BNR repeat-containing protein [Chthoniobacter flavus Ellin428]TCO94555.1 hypothetical protein EV701_10221 [Chthoniobacter flavus]